MASPDPGIESRWWSADDPRPVGRASHQTASCSGASSSIPSTSQEHDSGPPGVPKHRPRRRTGKKDGGLEAASGSKGKGSARPPRRVRKRDGMDRKRNGRRREGKRMVYGEGETQTVVEEDIDRGVWKVSRWVDKGARIDNQCSSPTC